jgi:hypothetical protein
MLNELEKQKTDLVERDSVRVKFADGQEWAILKPYLTVRPVFKDGVSTGTYRAFSYGQPVDDLLGMLAGADHADDVVSAAATLAGCLLRLQYDLDDNDLDQLLAFRVDSPESIGWVSRVVEIATGKFGRRIGIEVTRA